jgi:transposase
MRHCIIVGCDQHKKSLSICAAMDKEEPVVWRVQNSSQGRQELIKRVKEMAAPKRADIELTYEASYLGFGLCDELQDAGITCHVLAATKIPTCPHQRRNKTDAKDALRLFELLRGHVLAGNELPDVWVPDKALRDDREITRARLDVTDKLTAIKLQMRALLARCNVEKPDDLKVRTWTKSWRAWVAGLAIGAGDVLRPGAQVALCSLLNQLSDLKRTLKDLDTQVQALAESPRYRDAVGRLLRIKGVGLLGAMVFLTEIGDMDRFPNRRTIGAYLGLAPSSYESGESGDRKGHITRHGPPRVRRILCQAAWVWTYRDPANTQFYHRLVARNPKHKKKAVVAAMRRLGILMWHTAKEPLPRPQAA